MRARVLALLLALSLGLAAAATAAPSGPSTAAVRTLSSAGYTATDLRGTHGLAEFFIPLPAGTVPRGTGEVRLRLDRSGLLAPTSTLTVLAGDRSLGSTRLTSLPTTGGVFAVPLPASAVGANGLALTVRAFLRLTTDECEETTNPAKHVTLLPTSTVRLPTADAPRDLARVASLLTDGPGMPSVEVPASDPESLNAAAAVAGQIGRWAADRQVDALLGPFDKAGAQSDRPRVVVSPEAPAGFASPPVATGGALALAPAPARALWVGGPGPAARLAAEALDNDGLTGTALAVTGPDVAPTAAGRPWRDGAASFAQLGIERRELVGLGARELALTVDRPASWQIGRDAAIELRLDAAAQLTRSSVQLLAGGVDLGTRALVAGGGQHAYRFQVPDGLLDRRVDARPVRTLDLQIRFQLQLPQEPCQPLDAAAARVSVLPTSRIELPHSEAPATDLGRFPWPVQRADAATTVVLPRSPSPKAVQAGLQVCAAIGRWSQDSDLLPQLVTADRVSGEQRKGGLVLLGDADAELGSRLDLGRPAVQPTADVAVALVGLKDRRLVLRGDDEGLLLAARALGSKRSLAVLRGSRVALQGPAVQALGTEGVLSAPPALAPVLDEGGWWANRPPYAVPALVVLVALLATLALIARHRWFRGTKH